MAFKLLLMLQIINYVVFPMGLFLFWDTLLFPNFPNGLPCYLQEAGNFSEETEVAESSLTTTKLNTKGVG
jgi:hypothetical protein